MSEGDGKMFNIGFLSGIVPRKLSNAFYDDLCNFIEQEIHHVNTIICEGNIAEILYTAVPNEYCYDESKNLENHADKMIVLPFGSHGIITRIDELLSKKPKLQVYLPTNHNSCQDVRGLDERVTVVSSLSDINFQTSD